MEAINFDVSLEPRHGQDEAAPPGAASANRLTNYLGELVGLLVDFFFVLSLDHHASQILGSRITKQQPPSPLQVTLHAISFGLDLRDRFERRLASNANVHQNLRISSHSRCKLSE